MTRGKLCNLHVLFADDTDERGSGVKSKQTVVRYMAIFLLAFEN